MTLIKFEDLLDTGAHFGHVTRKWHPNYKPYVLMEKNGVHIINLDETISSFKKATDFIQSVVKKNGEILFIGTKKQAKDIVQQEADKCGWPLLEVVVVQVQRLELRPHRDSSRYRVLRDGIILNGGHIYYY